MAVRQLLGRWSRTRQAEQLLDGRAAPLWQPLRSFHACRWLAAEAQPQAPAPAIPMSTELHAYDEEDIDTELTPKQVVAKLDRYIVGQADAKRAVANALRNRWRRHRIDSPMKEEIVPKNILMIGPTGCGKTEIARRLAKLADAPFVKVEATKFTEVGFHGRDVDQIVRDLVDAAIIQTRARLRRRNRAAIAAAVEERILDAVLGTESKDNTREAFRELYRARQMDERKIKVEVAAARPGGLGAVVEGLPSPAAMQHMLSTLEKAMARSPGAAQLRELTIAEARPLLEEAETERLVTSESVTREAVAAVEADGIVFIDEIDKIVINHELRYGADASSEGVQRDLLPIIEGSVVSTKYGNVATDHILFICSGAFHSCKPSDMLAELQGRLPIRVELKGLTKEDFTRILTEPENNMIRQQQALLATEGIDLHFTADAIEEVARVAEEVNSSVDNIGARRLHTVLERILEQISFEAPERVREAAEGGSDGRLFMAVDKELVAERVGELLKKQDLSKYVL